MGRSIPIAIWNLELVMMSNRFSPKSEDQLLPPLAS